jgi:uncharacterized damage-inducible protein DinB
VQADSFSNLEAATFWRYIASSLDRLVALGTALTHEGLHWRPPAPEANSIAMLIFHTLGNAVENILEVLCGVPVERDRDAEFAARAVTGDELAARWSALRPRLEGALSQLGQDELDRMRTHPRRGTVTGREVLVVVARHAAEHLGQAELTRDLFLASNAPSP